MDIKIKNLCGGKYNLSTGLLCFPIDTEGNLILDKKSALEIMHTLLDSVGLQNENTEELMEKVEERLNG